MSQKKPFYGYVVLVCCIVIFIACNIASGTFSQFISPICEEFGFARSAFTLTTFFQYGCGSLFVFFFGPISRKIGLKAVEIIGFTLTCIAYLIYYISTELWQFYIGGSLLGIGIAFSLAVPLSTVISNWFIKNRGLFLGIMSASTGVGGMIFNPVIANVLAYSNWRDVWFTLAIIVWVVCFIAWLLMKVHPSDKGQTALGADTAADAENEAANEALLGLTAKEARKTKSYPLLFIGFMLCVFSAQCLYYAISPSVTDAFEGTAGTLLAGTVMSVLSFSQMVGKIAGGFLKDKFGGRGLMFCLLVGAVGCAACLLIGGSEILFFVAGALFGLVMIIFSVPLSMLVSEIFGTKYMGDIVGQMSVGQYIGIALGGTVIGLFYDAFGDYKIGMIVMSVLFIVGFLMVMAALKLKPDWKHAESR